MVAQNGARNGTPRMFYLLKVCFYHYNLRSRKYREKLAAIPLENYFMYFKEFITLTEPGRLSQSVGRLIEESEVPGTISGLPQALLS